MECLLSISYKLYVNEPKGSLINIKVLSYQFRYSFIFILEIHIQNNTALILKLPPSISFKSFIVLIISAFDSYDRAENVKA